jgi:hypothetical protein
LLLWHSNWCDVTPLMERADVPAQHLQHTTQGQLRRSPCNPTHRFGSIVQLALLSMCPAGHASRLGC